MVQTIYIVRLNDDMYENTLYIGYRKTKEEAKQLAKQLEKRLAKDGFKQWDHDFRKYECGDTLETWSFMNDDLENRDIWLNDSPTLQDYFLSKKGEVIFYGDEKNELFANFDDAYNWMKEQEINSQFKL